LKAILVLVGGMGEDVLGLGLLMEERIGAATSFVASHLVIIVLKLPSLSLSLVGVACLKASKLPLLVPRNKVQINGIDQQPPPYDRNIYTALDLGAHKSVVNMALSDSLSNRLKMFYREFASVSSRIKRFV
jgi:hypothetical protein